MPYPARLGTDQEFAALRSALDDAGFTDAAVCQRMGLERVSQFRLDGEKYQEHEPEDSIGLLTWFLMEGGAVSPVGAARLPMKEFAALGLVSEQPEGACCTVMLYPTRGLYITSDRVKPVEANPDGQPHDDFVYGGIVPNTDLFLNLVPMGNCDAFLDLCAGSGVGALHAARNGAKHSYSYDVTQRSTDCAEFNRRLNAIPNTTASAGDLYDPAGDLTFDRIVAHPPYLPVFQKQFIFDSGGADGEQIVSRIIQGLPRHLRPGGRFFSLTMGTDRAKPFEQRLREWLGEAENEFDIAFVTRRVLTPHEYTAEAAAKKSAGRIDVPAWREVFKELGVEQLAYGFLMIQRRDRPRPVFTVRRQTGPKTGPQEHLRLLEWETSMVNGGAAKLLQSRPCAINGTKLRMLQRFENGAWVPEGYQLEVDYPFNSEIKGQPWAGYLLEIADGSKTGSALLERLIEDGAVSPETPPLEYAAVLGQMISGGFLAI